MSEELRAWSCGQWGHGGSCRIGNCNCSCHIPNAILGLASDLESESQDYANDPAAQESS